MLYQAMITRSSQKVLQLQTKASTVSSVESGNNKHHSKIGEGSSGGCDDSVEKKSVCEMRNKCALVR